MQHCDMLMPISMRSHDMLMSISVRSRAANRRSKQNKLALTCQADAGQASACVMRAANSESVA